MLIARDVDGGGRVRVHTRSRLDLLLYRMVAFRAFRLMMRWSPVRRPHSSRLIRISPLLIRTRKRRRQKTVAPRRSIPRGPGVLGTSRVPLPLNDLVRHRERRGEKTTKPFGPNANCNRTPRRSSFILRPLTLTMLGVIRYRDGLPIKNFPVWAIRPAAFVTISSILALCVVCLRNA